MAELIQLVGFRLVRLNVQMDPFKGLPENLPLTVETGYDVYTGTDDPCQFMMLLWIKGANTPTEEEQAGPSLEIHALGEFRVPAGLPDDQKDALVKFNGGMILYGLIRGQLAMVTGAFPFGSILLPTLDWQATVQDIETQRAALVAGASEGGGEPDSDTTHNYVWDHASVYRALEAKGLRSGSSRTNPKVFLYEQQQDIAILYSPESRKFKPRPLGFQSNQSARAKGGWRLEVYEAIRRFIPPGDERVRTRDWIEFDLPPDGWQALARVLEL